MTKSNKIRGLTAAIAVAALFGSQPAAANVIEINSMWAGFDTININYYGSTPSTSVHENAWTGGFETYNLTQDPGHLNAFQSFCVDIFDSFNFSVTSNDTLHPAASVISSQAATNLGKLFTNQHGLIDSTSSSAKNEAAFQLAVWEIVNETSELLSLNSGVFQAGASTNPQDPTKTGAVTLANTWLAQLRTTNYSGYNAYIWKVDSMVSGIGHAQDVVTFTPVPEPETYAMMLVGLGLLGFSARRKNQNMA